MIDDDDVDRALSWLVSNASKAAQARANKVLLEESCRTVKARLMKASGQESLGAQEREALASDEYQTHLEGLKAAVYEDTQYTLLRQAAEARIEAWRTMSSNNRAQTKVG